MIASDGLILIASVASVNKVTVSRLRKPNLNADYVR